MERMRRDGRGDSERERQTEQGKAKELDEEEEEESTRKEEQNDQESVDREEGLGRDGSINKDTMPETSRRLCLSETLSWKNAPKVLRNKCLDLLASRQTIPAWV